MKVLFRSLQCEIYISSVRHIDRFHQKYINVCAIYCGSVPQIVKGKVIFVSQDDHKDSACPRHKKTPPKTTPLIAHLRSKRSLGKGVN